MTNNPHTRADGTIYDPTGTCPDCGRRQGWDGHGYESCARIAEARAILDKIYQDSPRSRARVADALCLR